MDSNATLRLKFQRLHTEVLGLNLTSSIHHLFSEFVLSADDADDLLLEPSRRRRADRLLMTLHRSRNPVAFTELRRAIDAEPAYNWFIEMLDGMRLQRQDYEQVNVCGVQMSAAAETVSDCNGGAGKSPEYYRTSALVGRSLRRRFSDSVDDVDEIDGPVFGKNDNSGGRCFVSVNDVIKERVLSSRRRLTECPAGCRDEDEDADRHSVAAVDRSVSQPSTSCDCRISCATPSLCPAAEATHSISCATDETRQQRCRCSQHDTPHCSSSSSSPAVAAAGSAHGSGVLTESLMLARPRREPAFRRNRNQFLVQSSSTPSLACALPHQPPVAASLPAGKPIFGLACLPQLLLLVRQHTSQIELYSSSELCSTSTPLQRIYVPRLRNPNDLVAIASKSDVDYLQTESSGRVADEVFVLDSQRPVSCVFRVQLFNAALSKITSWPTDNQLASKLSVTSSSRSLLVIYPAVQRLGEFSPDGRPIRVVQLDPQILNPWHAVQLSPGSGDDGTSADSVEYLVCHGDKSDQLHRVCVVMATTLQQQQPSQAAAPRLVFGGMKGSPENGLLNVPSHVTVSPRRGLVYVADVNNCRVAVLDSRTLTHVRDIPLPRPSSPASAAAGVRHATNDVENSEPVCPHPLRLCLDDVTDKLFVACAVRGNKQWTFGKLLTYHV